MKMKLKCPSEDCTKVLSVDSELAGKTGKCPKCGTMFAIPAPPKKKKSPKKAESSNKPARSAKRPAKKKPAARKPKKKQEFVLSTDDFLDEPEDDLLEDDVDFEEDFLDEDEDDDFLPPPRSRSQGGRKGGKSGGGGNWGKVGIGIQILAIGLCVFAGAQGLMVLANLISQITYSGRAGIVVLWKLGAFVSFGAVIAWIVGYSFCVLAPKTNGAKGLAITLVSLGGVNLVLRFIDRIHAADQQSVALRQLFRRPECIRSQRSLDHFADSTFVLC